jgi:hypothetical protein
MIFQFFVVQKIEEKQRLKAIQLECEREQEELEAVKNAETKAKEKSVVRGTRKTAQKMSVSSADEG